MVLFTFLEVAATNIGIGTMGAALGAGLAAIAAGLGIGKIGSYAMEAIARQRCPKLKYLISMGVVTPTAPKATTAIEPPDADTYVGD